MSKKPVVVYGASGYTGRLVCEYLREYNIPFIAAGRSEDKLTDSMNSHVAGIETADYATSTTGVQVDLRGSGFTGWWGNLRGDAQGRRFGHGQTSHSQSHCSDHRGQHGPHPFPHRPALPAAVCLDHASAQRRRICDQSRRRGSPARSFAGATRSRAITPPPGLSGMPDPYRAAKKERVLFYAHALFLCLNTS